MNKSRILVVILFACLLMIPLASMNTANPSADLNAPSDSQSVLAQTDFDRIGAIEGIVTQIDPEGGVRNAIGTFQNASYYGITYTAPYQAAVESQMATGSGYVSMSQLEIAGRTVYPNGRIGDAAAMLTVMVNPIVVLPSNPADLSLVQPNIQEAHLLADEIVALYESDLFIEFDRLTTVKMASYIYFNYEGLYNLNEMVDFYIIQYVSIPTETAGNAALSAMKTRLSGLGGFMDLLEGPQWPMDRTDFAETLMFDHMSEIYNYYPSGFINPIMMVNNIYRPYVRADSTHTDYVEVVNMGVLALAGFDTPDYITDAAGTETYSLKQHVGYVGDIESKMFQDMTVNSISTIVAVAPTDLQINGVSIGWDYVGKDFSLNVPGDLYLPTGQFIPGDSTAEEIIQAMLVSYPYAMAYSMDMSISATIDPTMFDYVIDGLWTSPGPFPDLREYFLEMDWSMMFTGFPVEEVNQDALRMIMEQAGITPDSLMDEIDETLLQTDPMQALVEAFIKCFDNYHLLDILENTTYSNPFILEGFLNEYITDIDTLIADFTGVNLPSSYATKEAFAALIEDHFGLVLQGLWDAMAAFTGDTTNIKTAVQAMIDPEHLAEETVPYIVADLYSSAVSEYDYGMYINFDMPVYGTTEPPQLLWLSSEDIVLEFDLDISTIDFDGPHCVIRKTVPQEMDLGVDSTVTITVENIGDATAYDLKILDGITAGFDSDKQYYWNRATLSAGDTWTVTTTITPKLAGTYAEIPAILCYFNATLVSFEHGDLENWDGAALYTISAITSEQTIAGDGDWLPDDILGIPTIIVIAGGIGVVVIVIVIVVKKR